MLARKMEEHGTKCWYVLSLPSLTLSFGAKLTPPRRLVNTGWTGGPPGVGSRCPIRITRSIIDAIHDGSLASASASFSPSPVFELAVPGEIPGRDVPNELLDPRSVWSDKVAFEGQLRRLAVSDKNPRRRREGRELAADVGISRESRVCLTRRSSSESSFDETEMTVADSLSSTDTRQIARLRSSLLGQSSEQWDGV